MVIKSYIAINAYLKLVKYSSTNNALCNNLLLSTPEILTLLKHNSPAIKGGCVTRREQRQDPETSARKWSRCKEGMARDHGTN
jgi:hypothetical protein